MKVSIALATYNGEKFIREQLDSILQQSITNWELIICDDCSTDSTLQILNQYSSKDLRIKIFKNEINLGFKNNFEKAISLCSGDYIALSDQDDVWTRNHLETLLDNLGENDLVGANAFLSDENAKPMGIDLLSCSKIDFLPKTKDECFFYLLHSNIFQGSACLFRKSLVQKALPIPKIVKFHDYWLALTAASRNGVAYVNECILYYRQHGTNVTQNRKWNLWLKLKNQKNAKSDSEMKETMLLSLKDSFELTNERIAMLDVARKYHNYNKNSFFCLSYFIRNYKKIYLSKSKKLFILRLLKMMLRGA